jgi:hypothetical protein
MGLVIAFSLLLKNHKMLFSAILAYKDETQLRVPLNLAHFLRIIISFMHKFFLNAFGEFNFEIFHGGSL